ncbi:MAG: ATP-grasp domain-containing protein [Candidatus Gracilibacteria bacterium]
MKSPDSPRKTLKQKVMPGNVLHIPNIQDEAGVEGLKAIERYKLRSLMVLDPGDSSILPVNVQEETVEMLHIYDELNVPHLSAENIFFLDVSEGERLSTAVLRNKQAVEQFLKYVPGVDLFVPFIHSTDSDTIAESLGLHIQMNAASSEIVNDKGLSQQELRRVGVDTPLGRVVHNLDEAMVFCDELTKAGYKEVMFKITRSASGMGVFQIPFDEVPKYMEKYKEEVEARGVLLDGFIPGKMASPNIQYNIGDSESDDHFISCSDQILDNGVHLGNINDSDLYFGNDAARENVRKTRNWARQRGYRGIVGIDLYITEDGRPYYMETNARFNGSTPAALLADKLHGSTIHVPWGAQNNIGLPKGTTVNDFLAALDRDKLLYSPDSKLGVLPTNTSAIRTHAKAMVAVFAKTAEEVREVLATLDSYKSSSVA